MDNQGNYTGGLTSKDNGVEKKSTMLTRGENETNNHEKMESMDNAYEEQTKIAKKDIDIEAAQKQLSQETKEFQEKVINTQEPLTFQLLYGTTTAESLKKILADPSFKVYGETPNVRLQNIMTSINNSLSKYIHNQFRAERQKNPKFDELIKPKLDAMIKNVIVAGSERYLIESTKKLAEEKNSNTKNNIGGGLIENMNEIFGMFNSIISGKVGNIKTARNLMSAMNYLGEHQTEICNAIAKDETAEVLENPLTFLEKYLNHPARAEEKNIQKLKMTDVGLEFTQKTPDKKQENEKENEKINLTAEERTKIKGIIGNLNINVKPEKVHETIAFMQKLEKNIYVGNKIEKDIFSLLDRTEKNNFDITSSLKEDSPIKWLLSLWALFMGYNGGIDGLVKKRSAGKIENIDSKKKTTIQESFTSYQTAQSAKNAKQEKKAEKGKEKIDEENLQYLLGKALNKENKPLFDIDVPLLKDALIKHGDVNQFSPNVLASMGKIGQEFIKKETKKEEGKNVTSYILDPEKISLLEEKKEKVVDEYINFIAKDLLKKESYLEKLKESEDEKENSPVDKMVFTMIASLYIPQNVVINGVKSETFLPSILNEEKEQQDTTVEKSSKPIEQIASKEKNKSETSPIFTEKQLENRANRHNNPTVMSIDVARNLGLQEGIDYVRGDALKDNAKIFTAKLLWHGVETTIKGFDLAAKNPQEQIFYKSNGKVRRNHTAISDEERLALSPKEKRDFIEEMYNKEVQKTRRNFVAMSDPAQKENIA